MRINKKVKKNFEELKRINENSPDFNVRYIKLKHKYIGYAFYESVSSDDKISNYLIKSIINVSKRITIFDDLFNNIYNEIENSIYNSKIKVITTIKDTLFYLSSGFTIVFIDGYRKALAIETKEMLDRGVSEVQSEITIKGPKDAFTENYNKNIGLIRRRIKDENLIFKEVIIGKRTKTKVSISYIKDIARIDIVKKVEKKLKNIDIDGIIDVGYIRDFLIPDNKTSFPTCINTERPDLATSALLQGKVIIIMDTTPNVLIIPAVLNNFIHNQEDNYQKAINVTLTRTLRLLAMLITIVTPALYIAITTFNQEVIPDTLLISLAIQRSGVPFPTAFSIIILMITFEILRESDMRLPETMGTSISIVGALVLGDAAVNAGLVSPIVVIIVAITSITGLLFTDLDIVNAFRSWRFIFIIFSTLMGLIGFTVALVIFITKLCSIESFGTSYLEPYSPMNKMMFIDGTLTKPKNRIKARPNYIASKNLIRMRDNNEK